MKKYKSKIGVGIVLFIAIVLGGTSATLIVNGAWPGLIVNLVVAVFVVHLFATTFYIIKGNDLIVKSGFLLETTIKIDQIKKIRETHNPLASPAASLDRLAIYYNNAGFIMVSPKDKMSFISHLLKINDKIELLLKRDSKMASIEVAEGK